MTTRLPSSLAPIRLPGGCAAALAMIAGSASAGDLLKIRNGEITLGIDQARGGSITWLSWKGYRQNAVNIADPGRLIQQSYYAGQPLDRKTEGQHRAWSPWPWNPIQGGGVGSGGAGGSWARVTEFKRIDPGSAYCATVPKLWDMAGEEARALMRQWTGFEPGIPNAAVVRCEFVSQREENDRWGPAVPRHQEIPACYFTRNFAEVKSYLGDGKWRAESQPPGPPWGQANPPRRAMACFNAKGQGIAVFSPAAGTVWNFGPAGTELTGKPDAGPCMHIAPLDTAALAPKCEYRFRYWLLTGSEQELAASLETLWSKYSGEKVDYRKLP